MITQAQKELAQALRDSMDPEECLYTVLSAYLRVAESQRTNNED